MALRRRQDSTICDGGLSRKIHKFLQVKAIVNLKEYRTCIIGSKVTGILLNWCILPIIGVQPPEKVCARLANPIF